MKQKARFELLHRIQFDCWSMQHQAEGAHLNNRCLVQLPNVAFFHINVISDFQIVISKYIFCPLI